ncbi:hypothetical protein, partial [Eisenbergiella massiliensis]|uniref:hypothetical protein n=1 Tax=Eisenbergiella massiliensis TaxID=1720294 RepID=UPI0023F48A2C
SQVAMLAWIFGDCREGQSPRCRAAGALIGFVHGLFLSQMNIKFRAVYCIFRAISIYYKHQQGRELIVWLEIQRISASAWIPI